ncbi:MAG: hypothetical protein IJX25_04725 [Clostridia bacterium]|nr:hypothetical protein [Clostridia bacterium]MBQ8792125.1 hypothetical protein [Clostridia bacterium]
MEISKCSHKAKCDFYGCNNLAEYSFSTKGIIRRDLCFCQECLKGMYQAIGKMQTPKGTTSPFKLNKKLRREKDE